MSDNGDSAISFFAGFLFGGIVGAGVALLLAPQSGIETREQLQSKGIELKGRAEEYASVAQERAADVEARSRVVLTEQKARLGQAVAEGKAAAAKTKKELEAKLSAAKSGASSVVQG
jgi:gas vesicle protein